MALLAGGAVRGGRIGGDWPDLAPEALLDGRDLRPTTDLRVVFKGLLAEASGGAGIGAGDADLSRQRRGAAAGKAAARLR